MASGGTLVGEWSRAAKGSILQFGERVAHLAGPTASDLVVVCTGDHGARTFGRWRMAVIG